MSAIKILQYIEHGHQREALTGIKSQAVADLLESNKPAFYQEGLVWASAKYVRLYGGKIVIELESGSNKP